MQILIDIGNAVNNVTSAFFGHRKIHRNSIKITVDLWRSGRDSNPRTAFDRHTISSRARYDRFDTTP